MTTYGWDASNYDDPIRVRDGIDLYSHKAAEGHHFYYDREYRASMDAARGLGIPVLGAYYVNHPGTVEDQVDWFVQLLDQDTPWWRAHPCFVLQIDAEQFGYMDRAPTPAEIQAFGDRLVQVHGVARERVLAYAPQWLYGNTLTGLTYRLWASAYGSNPTVHYLQAYPGDQDVERWQSYSGQAPLLLQYGSNTTIGDQTTCDANAYRGTLAELLAELGAAPAPPEEDDMIAHLWRDTAQQHWYVTGPLQFKRRVSKAEADTIRYYSTYQSGFTLVDLVGGHAQDTDPAVIPGVDVATLGADLSPEALADVEAAAKEGAEAGAPTEDELVAAAEKGANLAEDS